MSTVDVDTMENEHQPRQRKQNQRKGKRKAAPQASTDATNNDYDEEPPAEAAGAAASGAKAKKPRRPPRKELPVSLWYEACKKFMDNPEKYNNSQSAFLRSEDSGVLDEYQKMSFGKRLRSYKAGKLPQMSGIKRVRKGKYRDVEQCLIAYIETRNKFSKGKMAITWPFLIELSKRFALALGYSETEFRASPGWLSNVLKRNNKSLNDDINDDDVMVYLESIKKYCKKKGFGREIETQCDHLFGLIRNEVKGDDEEDSSSDDDEEEQEDDTNYLSQQPRLSNVFDLNQTITTQQQQPQQQLQRQRNHQHPSAYSPTVGNAPYWPL